MINTEAYKEKCNREFREKMLDIEQRKSVLEKEAERLRIRHKLKLEIIDEFDVMSNSTSGNGSAPKSILEDDGPPEPPASLTSSRAKKQKKPAKSRLNFRRGSKMHRVFEMLAEPRTAKQIHRKTGIKTHYIRSCIAKLEKSGGSTAVNKVGGTYRAGFIYQRVNKIDSTDSGKSGKKRSEVVESRILRFCAIPLTTRQIARKIGRCKVTARRYLRKLIKEGKISREYGVASHGAPVYTTVK